SALGGEPLTIRLSYQGQAPITNVEVHVRVCNEHGTSVTLLSSRFTGDALSVLPAEGTVDCHIPDLCLAPGSYLLDLDLEAGLEYLDRVSGAARLEVEPGPFFATGRTPSSESGPLLTRHHWTAAPAVPLS